MSGEVERCTSETQPPSSGSRARLRLSGLSGFGPSPAYHYVQHRLGRSEGLDRGTSCHASEPFCLLPYCWSRQNMVFVEQGEFNPLSGSGDKK